MIDTLSKGLPAGLERLAQLGRTLWRRRDDHPGVLRHRSVERPGGGDQREAGASAWYRVGVPEQGPLHLAVTESLWWASICDQRTVNREEPENTADTSIYCVPQDNFFDASVRTLMTWGTIGFVDRKPSATGI